MLERRPILGLILVLNVCVLIWISVQEPAMLDAEIEDAGGGYAGVTAVAAIAALNVNSRQQQFNNNNKPQRQSKNDFPSAAEQQLQQQNAQQHQQQLYAGKHLLSKRTEMNDSAGVGLATDKAVTMGKKYIYKVATSLKQNKRSNKNSNKTLALSSKLTTTATAVSPTATLRDKRRAGAAAVVGAASTGAFNSSASLAGSLPEHDFSQLIDFHNFSYLMPQQACNANIQVLILVHSAPLNLEKRELIRETWASIAIGISQLRVIFLLGAVQSLKMQQDLQQENALYGDIVQGSFQDDYRNMTYKHVMALKWFIYNCAHAQILIKVDDDVFVNTPLLLKYSTTAANKTVANSVAVNAASHNFIPSDELFQHPQNLIFCEVSMASKVKRSYRSKWRVNFKEYAERYYPPYCPGYAILYSRDVVLRLYEAAQMHKYFWIDDVLITGILAQHSNLTITPSSQYILRRWHCEKLLSSNKNLNAVKFLYAGHMFSRKQLRDLWLWHLENTKDSASLSTSDTSDDYFR